MKTLSTILIISLCAASAGRAADWPWFRGPDHNGVSAETGWFKPGAAAKTVWEAAVGAGYSAVAIRDGRLYTMGNRQGKDTVYCLDAATGKTVWTHEYDCKAGSYPGPRCTPAVDGSGVFTLSREGRLLCLGAADGKVIWQRDLGAEMGLSLPQWGLAGSPLVTGNLLIVNVGAGGLAVDKATGKTKWDSGGQGSGYASPVLFSQGSAPSVVIFAAREVVSVAPATGKAFWRFAWKTSYDVNAADPLPVDGRLLITSGYGRGGALLEPGQGAPKVIWEAKSLASHFSTPVLWKDRLYGISGNVGKGETRCVDPATGATVWGAKETGFGNLMLADGKLIILNEKGTLFIAEAAPDAYRELWSGKVMDGVCWTMPTLCNGRIYCRNEKGRLVCLDLRQE